MVLDATGKYDEPLTPERLFGWQASLFPTGRSGMRPIAVGRWRDDSTGPMQVVSGPVGREHVHFEAPRASRVAGDMAAFLDWFDLEEGTDWILKGCLAHLWFVVIHPFDDGNGRIARAIADMALARSERSAQRFYSMSSQIRQERNAYYEILARTSNGDLDITAWIDWFFGCLGRALEGAYDTLAVVLSRTRFWEAVGYGTVNERQHAVLNRLLDGFEGKLTTSKWARLAKCSTVTAWRDIQALVERGILRPSAEGGRSTSYELVVPGEPL